MDSIELIYNNKDNSYVPKLLENDYYPTVSVVTPTYKRSDIFDIAIFNWKNFVYPPELIEWIILDDSPRDSINELKQKLPKDKRIFYYTSKKIDNIGKKRNKVNQLAKNDIIIHMDDDDYYPPDSIINRVRALLSYDKRCVGCSSVNCINLLDNTCFKTWGGYLNNTIVTAEASLCYYKTFWKEQNYDPNVNSEECKKFLENRTNLYIDLHSAFIMIAITHSKNMSNRVLNNSINKYNFFDSLPVNVVNLLEELQLRIHSKLPGVAEAKDFIKRNYGKSSAVILSKIKQLPVEVLSTSVMSCYIEDITSSEPIVNNSVCILYFPGTTYRNINRVSKNNFDAKFTQLLKFVEYYFNNHSIRLYAHTFEEFKIDRVNIIPWYFYNKKISSDFVILVDEYSHISTIENMNKNRILYLNLSNLIQSYPPNFLDSLSLFYTFFDKNEILRNNVISSMVFIEQIKPFYIGLGEEIKNNKLFIETKYDGDLNKYKSIHTYNYLHLNDPKIKRDDDVNCEFYVGNSIDLIQLSFLISKGIKYLTVEKTEESNKLNILSIDEDVPDNYFMLLHETIKKELTN